MHYGKSTRQHPEVGCQPPLWPGAACDDGNVLLCADHAAAPGQRGLLSACQSHRDTGCHTGPYRSGLNRETEAPCRLANVRNGDSGCVWVDISAFLILFLYLQILK